MADAARAQLLRYIGVGLVNTAVGWGSTMLLRFVFGWADFPANIGGFVLGACNSYVLNKRFTFRSKQRHARAAPRFVALVLAAWSLNALVLALALRLGAGSLVAQTVAMLTYNVAFFLGSKHVVFRS